MPQELLPLFPLPLVLFPRTQLPLHIFEERYKEMVGEAIQNKTEFGVVLAAEKGIVNTGCSALVEKVTQRYDDGRLDIIILGLRRFEVLELNNEKDYLRGTVSYFNDEETQTTPADVRERALFGYEELCRSLGNESVPEPEWQDPQLSFQLAQSVTDLNFRQTLLATRSEAERMGLLADFLPEHLEQQRHITHVRRVAPTNGHGKTPEDI